MTQDKTANYHDGGGTGSHSEGCPRIYIACLAAYNNGYLHGCWVDAARDADAILSEISKMLDASPIDDAEEWAIHDHEGFEGVTIHEYAGIEKVALIGEYVAERGRLGAKVLEHCDGDLDEAHAAFDNYAGAYASLADFAQDLVGETTDIPENLVSYIDYSAIARDMELNGDVFSVELGFEDVHVFWSR